MIVYIDIHPHSHPPKSRYRTFPTSHTVPMPPFQEYTSQHKLYADFYQLLPLPDIKLHVNRILQDNLWSLLSFNQHNFFLRFVHVAVISSLPS